MEWRIAPKFQWERGRHTLLGLGTHGHKSIHPPRCAVDATEVKFKPRGKIRTDILMVLWAE